MGWFDWLRRKPKHKPPSAPENVTGDYMLGRLTIAGSFNGKDTAPTPQPESITAVKLYRMPGTVPITGNVTTFTPALPQAPGTVLQFSTVVNGLDLPVGANIIAVSFVDDEGTEGSQTQVTVNATDVGPSAPTGLTATFVPS